MKPDLPRIDLALPALRELLRSAAVPFKVAGGVAVIHHGFERFTRDLDVLVSSNASEALDPLLASHGFERVSEVRLRHVSTGVRVNLLVAGRSLAGPRDPRPFPNPVDCGGSASDPDVIGLVELVSLKLSAGRRQDLADVMKLMKVVDEAAYIALEASVPAMHRQELHDLRVEALEELTWDALNGE